MPFVTGVATRKVVVVKDSVLGNGDTYTFLADHWHLFPDGSLEVVDNNAESVADFRPTCWDHVFFADSVANIEPRRS